MEEFIKKYGNANTIMIIQMGLLDIYDMSNKSIEEIKQYYLRELNREINFYQTHPPMDKTEQNYCDTLIIEYNRFK